VYRTWNVHIGETNLERAATQDSMLLPHLFYTGTRAPLPCAPSLTVPFRKVDDWIGSTWLRKRPSHRTAQLRVSPSPITSGFVHDVITECSVLVTQLDWTLFSSRALRMCSQCGVQRQQARLIVFTRCLHNVPRISTYERELQAGFNDSWST
jgi:hypothetical protein